MVYYFLFFNGLIILAIFTLASSEKYNHFAHSAANPLCIFGVISILFNIDFLYIWVNPTIFTVEHPIALVPLDIDRIYGTYTMLAGATLLGFLTAHYSSRVSRKDAPSPTPTDGAQRQIMMTNSAWLHFFAVMAAAAALISLLNAIDQILAGRLTFQVFARANPAFFLALNALLPSLSIFLSLRRLRSLRVLVVILLSIMPLLFVGVRSFVVVAILMVSVSMVNAGRRLSVALYVLLLPGLSVFASISAYFLRFGWKYSSYADFVTDSGGYLNLFFGSEELGLAKSFSALVMSLDRLDWGPFGSLAGMALFPLPRNIFPFKPVGASAYVTEQLSPLRWLLTKSESTITSYGDLLLSFGGSGAAIVIALLAFLWLRGCIWAIHARSPWNGIWLPFLIWWMFVFVRGDLYNVSAVAWPFLVVVGIYWISVRWRLRWRIGPRSHRLLPSVTKFDASEVPTPVARREQGNLFCAGEGMKNTIEVSANRQTDQTRGFGG